MNRHLLLFVAIFVLLLSWLKTLRHYLCTWFAHLRAKPSVAKRRRKNKSLPHLFPTKRPECLLCQAEETLPSEESSILSEGSIITRCEIQNSVIGIRSIVRSGANIFNSVVMGGGRYESFDEQKINIENAEICASIT